MMQDKIKEQLLAYIPVAERKKQGFYTVEEIAEILLPIESFLSDYASHQHYIKSLMIKVREHIGPKAIKPKIHLYEEYWGTVRLSPKNYYSEWQHPKAKFDQKSDLFEISEFCRWFGLIGCLEEASPKSVPVIISWLPYEKWRKLAIDGFLDYLMRYIVETKLRHPTKGLDWLDMLFRDANNTYSLKNCKGKPITKDYLCRLYLMRDGENIIRCKTIFDDVRANLVARGLLQ